MNRACARGVRPPVGNSRRASSASSTLRVGSSNTSPARRGSNGRRLRRYFDAPHGMERRGCKDSAPGIFFAFRLAVAGRPLFLCGGGDWRWFGRGIGMRALIEKVVEMLLIQARPFEG